MLGIVIHATHQKFAKVAYTCVIGNIKPQFTITITNQDVNAKNQIHANFKIKDVKSKHKYKNK